LNPTAGGICEAFGNIASSFQTLVNQAPFDQGVPRSDLFGQSLRYVFHDAGETLDPSASDGLRSDGCLSDTADNAGIIEDDSVIESVFDPIWQDNCHLISRADFFVLMGILVMSEADPTGTIADNIGFQFGRIDTQQCAVSEARLPSAQGGLNELNRVFVTNMGLTMSDAVTLLGAHSIGHVHAANSGYSSNNINNNNINLINAWDNSPTVFDSTYYNSVIAVPWRNNEAPANPNTLNIWDRNNGNIMTNIDMSIAFEIDETTNGLCFMCGNLNEVCGGNNANNQNCRVNGQQTGGQSSTFAQANNYRNNNQLFLNDFMVSYTRMAAVGYGDSLIDIDLASCPA
jgi:hypothetical protein